MVVTARYYRVSPQFWHASAGWEDRIRLLGLYVQTCEHRTTEGLYRLPVAYIHGDLGWPAKTVEGKLADLECVGLIKYDAKAEVLLLLDALESQPPRTEPQVKGAMARLRTVPPTPLLAKLYDLAQAHASELAEAIREENGFLSGENAGSSPIGNVTPLASRVPAPAHTHASATPTQRSGVSNS